MGISPVTSYSGVKRYCVVTKVGCATATCRLVGTALCQFLRLEPSWCVGWQLASGVSGGGNNAMLCTSTHSSRAEDLPHGVSVILGWILFTGQQLSQGIMKMSIPPSGPKESFWDLCRSREYGACRPASAPRMSAVLRALHRIENFT